jgi:hypothetical protein
VEPAELDVDAPEHAASSRVAAATAEPATSARRPLRLTFFKRVLHVIGWRTVSGWQPGGAGDTHVRVILLPERFRCV